MRDYLFFFYFFVLLISCKEKSSTYVSVPEKDISELFPTTDVIPDSLFLGADACKKCHQAEFNDWQESHHDKAMQMANDSTVLADFDGEKFTSQGVISHFFKRDGKFYANTEGPDGRYHDYKIIYTFGITPLQQYIVEFPNGRYQCLRTAWDTEKNKWFDLYPDFKVVHSEWLHWSRGGLNWNTMCSDCHSTNVRKNFDPKTEIYDTKFSLINVSCEACHGPGKQHVADVERMGDDYAATNTLQMTAMTKPKELVDQCARCHMRREQISDQFNFQGTMLDHYFPELIREGLYHPDGQILDEDYVYGSFIQSKMYMNNVTCKDCHNPHSLEIKFKGNKLCVQCHIPEQYNTPDHHFHDMGSEGSKCIECHMPGKYYMGNDFRRDHSFRIPRPDLSLKYDTPNACVGCHEDKDHEWAWNVFKEQYGVPDYQHFSELLAPGITGAPDGKDALLKLLKDTTQPEIARASAVRAMGNNLSEQDVAELLRFLDDMSPLVRATSVDVLGQIDNTDHARYLLPLLKDNKRSVRVNAFYAISRLNEFQIPAKYLEVYQKVKKEFWASMNINADFPGGRAKMADYYIRKGNIQKGIESYEKALDIDPLNNIIRTNLANLYYNNKEIDNAEKAFRTVIEQEPEFGPTYYSLGLLLAEVQKTNEAIQQLEKAIHYMPQNLRVYYNLSLLYDKTNAMKKAKETILKGLTISPQDESLLYTAAYLYSKNQELQKAREYAQKLIETQPNNPQYKALLQQLNTTAQ